MTTDHPLLSSKRPLRRTADVKQEEGVASDFVIFGSFSGRKWVTRYRGTKLTHMQSLVFPYRTIA